MNIDIKHFKSTQNGAALIVSLLILMVMTLIGVTAMSSSNLEEKMAGNSRDKLLAFQAAEAALWGGDAFVSGLVTAGSFTDCTPPYINEGCNPDLSPDSSIWDSAVTYNLEGVLPGADSIKSNPKYVIELLGTIQSLDPNAYGYGESSGVATATIFRITARGTGGTDNAISMLQVYHGSYL